MTMTNPNDDMLDGLFAQARKSAPEPSDALIARVLADAAAQHAPALLKPVARPTLFARLLDSIGGWPAVSGLAAATVAGVWIGIAPPTSVQDITATLLGDEISVDIFPTGLELQIGALADG